MPNWCEIHITIKSKKEKRIQKIIDKLNEEKAYISHYGNLQMFDTIALMDEFVMDYLDIDKETFKYYMRFMYKNLIYVDLNVYGKITKDYITKLFDTVKIFMESDSLPVINDPNLIRMRALIKPPQIVQYRDENPITDYLTPDEIKNIKYFKPPHEYWGWSNRNIGVKWDISSYGSKLDEDELNIIYDPETNMHSISFYGTTAWTYPDEFLQKLCKKFKVFADVSYYEPGLVFAGYKKYDKHGQVIEDKIIDDVPYCRFIVDAERLMGYPEEDSFEVLLDMYDDYDDNEDISDKLDAIEYLYKTTKYDHIKKKIASEMK
ncbi:hypothetical protein V6O07_04880, partial [Arthrospira platensis SPKY2]